MRRLRRPAVWVTLALAVLTVGPLVALGWYSVDRAGRAVEEEARVRLQSTAAVSAALVRTELQGLADLVASYGKRPSLVAALTGPPSSERTEALLLHLHQLRAQRPGIAVTFATEPDGRLIEIRPATPAIVGKDFSFRDWYRGALTREGPYLSPAFIGAATGRPHVVAAAVRVRAGAPPATVGVLAAAYDLDHLRTVADRLAREQDVVLTITDQDGTVVAGPGSESGALRRARDDGVAAALAGRAGTFVDEARDLVTAYAPVRPFGYAVTASASRQVTFSRVDRVRDGVVAIAVVLAGVLAVALGLLAVALRRREQAEQRERAALAEARRLAEINGAVLDATVDAIRMVDAEGRTVLVNRAMRETFAPILRFAGDGTIWELTEALADRTRDPAAYRAATAALRDDPAREAVDEYELPDESTWIQRYSAPVRDASGSIVGRIFVLRDVTRERRADRMKAELVATVSHELRTPLTGVLGFAELLARDGLDEATRQHYLEIIVGEAARLRDLLSDFLDLQRAEEQRLTVALEPVELNPILETQASLCAAQSDRHTVELDLDENLEVVGEPNRIAQMLANLLSNAVKYSPLGGAVRLTARRTGAVVRIEVADEGVGIPLDQQPRIFERFFRVDSSDTRAIGGTGLGLALVRELAEAHGGRAGFESVEGEGSTFWVELPRAYRPDAEVAAKPLALVVEDDPRMSALLQQELGELGYAIEVCASGTEALERAERSRPNVILLDIGLPGRLDGWEVLSRLAASPPTASIPVLVCSGSDHAERARGAGAAGFLRKPFTHEELAAVLARLPAPPRRCVLVVDEEETVRNLVAVALEREPVEVIEAVDGRQALELVERRRPAVVVLDLHLPVLDGFAVLERLRDGAGRPRIPTIVLTGVELDPAEAAALRSMGVWLLEKQSYSAPELRRLVAVALAADTDDAA